MSDEDLWSMIENGLFKPRIEKQRSSGPQKKGQMLFPARNPDPVKLAAKKLEEPPENWLPEKRILVLYSCLCETCGEESLLPEILPEGKTLPLIRFKNKRTGALWERRVEPFMFHGNLQTESRILPGRVANCTRCLEKGNSGQNLVQLNLEF